MFIVTVEHCAQALSCQTFPDKFIPNNFFITIHMPLFMIASGFVINFDKIRMSPMKEYFSNKFTRLVIPLLTWVVIHSIFTISLPSVSNLFKTYWYLSALFFSLITIRLFSSFIKNNTMLIIITLLVVLVVPISKTSHTNFMFPFLIYGYLLKKFINKMNLIHAIIFAVAFILLYALYWGIEHTVYLKPLDTMNISQNMIYSFLLRLSIGIAGSTFVFMLVKSLHSPLIQKISRYGEYTLIFYTMTSVINGFTRRFFSFMDFSISNPYILDIVAIIFALAQMYLIYKFARIIEDKPKLSKLLLGK